MVEGLRRAGRFLVPFLELQIPMVLGAVGCYMLGRLISETSLGTAYRPGTYLFAVGDVLFLTVPVAAWTLLRGRDTRRSLELASAMIAPVAFIALSGEVAGYPYLLWLVTGMYPAMSLGMLVFFVCSRDRFPREMDRPCRSARAGL